MRDVKRKDTESKAWDKQPTETTLWYNRFCDYYLTQPPIRSMQEAYRRYYQEKHRGNQEKLKKQPNCPVLWRQKSKEYEWIKRAAAYDVWVREERDRQREQLLFKWEEEKGKMIDKAIAVTLGALKVVDLSEVTLPQVVGAISTLAKEIRLEREEVTDRIAVEGEVSPLSQQQIAERIQSIIEAARKKKERADEEDF